jgi:hypothetical protein
MAGHTLTVLSLVKGGGGHCMAQHVSYRRGVKGHGQRETPCSRLYFLFFPLWAGSFWLNPPLPMDEDGNWVGPTKPKRPAELVDVDPV